MNTLNNSNTRKTGPFLRIGSHFLYATVVTVFGVLAGLIGSLFKEEIRNAWPLRVIPTEPAIYPFIFWAAVLLFALLFFWRQAATDIQQKRQYLASERQQAQLANQVDKLEQIVRTMPKEEFLDFYALTYQQIHRLARNQIASGTDSVKDTIAAIRTVLDGIVTLADLFHDRDKDDVYSANIMMFKPIEGASAAEIGVFEKQILFVEPECDVRKLAGVLALEREMSCTTRAGAEDAALVDLVLPVPKFGVSAEESRKSRVIAGAPAAFVFGGIETFSEIAQMDDWLDRYGDFSEFVRQRITWHFAEGPGKDIGSFASLPLSLSEQKDRYLPIGVLNIHRSRPGMFANEDAARLFFPLLMPFQSLLVDFMVELEHLKSGTYNNTTGLTDTNSAPTMSQDNAQQTDRGA